MAWLLCRTTPLPIATLSRSLSSLGSLSSASRLCAARPAARLGVLRVAAGHAADAYDPRHSSSNHAQQSAPFASYTGRGKPTRTRTRVQEETPAEQSTRYSEIAKRHDESVAQSQRHSETAATERQADSLHDAGLKNFMVNVYTTTGGCIGMAAVGSVLPILGVVPMVHPLIPGLGMIVRARAAGVRRILSVTRRAAPPCLRELTRRLVCVLTSLASGVCVCVCIGCAVGDVLLPDVVHRQQHEPDQAHSAHRRVRWDDWHDACASDSCVLFDRSDHRAYGLRPLVPDFCGRNGRRADGPKGFHAEVRAGPRGRNMLSHWFATGGGACDDTRH